MRSVFLFLLLLNVLYALWQLQDDKAVQALYDVADTSLEQLDVVAESSSSMLERKDPELGSAQVKTSLCVNLGVFQSRDKAEQLRQRLLALSVESKVIVRDVSGTLDYWLVYPVRGDEGAALSRLGLLQAEGIDSFLITRGDLAGNISLGVFGRENNAMARQAQLQAMGYPVEIEMLEKLTSEYLVQVDASERRLVNQPMLARLRESFPGLQHQFDPCQAVAN
jgi:hypothetical protein